MFHMHLVNRREVFLTEFTEDKTPMKLDYYILETKVSENPDFCGIPDDAIAESPEHYYKFIIQEKISEQENLKEDDFREAPSNVRQSYGVGIVKTTLSDDTEEELLFDLSLCKKSIMRLVDFLSDNLVTPVGLKAVIEDMLESDTISSLSEY